MKLVALVLFTAACGSSIQATEINSAPRPLAARPPETVEVFTSGPPLRPHMDLAFYEAQQESEFSSDDTADFITKMRKVAARRGCDGLVIGGVTHETTGAILDRHQPRSNKGMTATCIVYTDSPPPAPAQIADAREACLAERRAAFQRANVTSDAQERGRIFNAMPRCDE